MGFTSLTSGPAGLSRLTHPAAAGDEGSGPEAEEALALSDKLDRASREGGLLILSVLPKHAEAAKQQLAQRFAPNGLSVYSIEEAILRHLKAFAHSKHIQWPVILLADAADRTSSDFRKLQTAMSAALSQMVDRDLPCVLAAFADSTGAARAIRPAQRCDRIDSARDRRRTGKHHPTARRTAVCLAAASQR
jgi:hypothetical protein